MTAVQAMLFVLLGLGGTEDPTFELPLPLSASALEQASIYVSRNQVVLYAANAQAQAFDKRYEKGPVTRAHGYGVAHGYVVALDARDNAVQLRDVLQKRSHPTPSLGVAMPELPPNTEAATTAPAPMDTIFAQTPKRNDDALSQLQAGQPQTMRGHWLLGVVAGVGLLTAAAWLWHRRPRVNSAAQGLSIDILAVRALGPRHKLALVSTCGDRLLICASDKGVTVLSHLQRMDTPVEEATSETDSSFDDALRAADVRGLRDLARGRTGAAS